MALCWSLSRLPWSLWRPKRSAQDWARGLRSIVEEALLDVMYEIPSRDDIVRCVIQANVFTQHESPLLFNAHGHTVVLARDLKNAA